MHNQNKTKYVDGKVYDAKTLTCKNKNTQV